MLTQIDDYLAVVMHLLALGAFWPYCICLVIGVTFVVMHLLALGAFWLSKRASVRPWVRCRNAPSGARCFLARPYP